MARTWITSILSVICFLVAVALTFLIAFGKVPAWNYIPGAVFLFVGLLVIPTPKGDKSGSEIRKQ